MTHHLVSLYVTSHAPAKLEAARLAAAGVGLPVEVHAVPGESGVAHMPIGEAETLAGAHNRVASVYERVEAHHRAHAPGRAAVVVSVENGLVRTANNQGLRDVAALVVQPLGEAPRVALSDAVPVPNDVAAAVLAGKGALTTGQVLAKHTAGLDPQDWHARLDARGRTRTRIVADALAPLLAELQAELERSGRLALDVAEDAPDVFVAEAGRLRVRLPVKSTPHGAMAFFDLFHPAALAANARLGAELATRLPPEVDVIVSPEGKGVLLAHEVARAARRELVVLRKKARGFDVVAHALEYRSVTTPEPQSLHLTAAVAARVRGKHVAIVDDVVSTGGTVNALRELLTLGGASSVAVVAVFTEGSPRADVITLGHLPFPVPAEALLRA